MIGRFFKISTAEGIVLESSGFLQFQGGPFKFSDPIVALPVLPHQLEVTNFYQPGHCLSSTIRL